MAVSQGKSVIIDNTNPDRKTRQRLVHFPYAKKIYLYCTIEIKAMYKLSFIMMRMTFREVSCFVVYCLLQLKSFFDLFLSVWYAMLFLSYMLSLIPILSMGYSAVSNVFMSSIRKLVGL